MGDSMGAQEQWYRVVRSYTERLVRIPSISPGKEEIAMAHEVRNLLLEDDLQNAYTDCGFDQIKGDPYHRKNTYAFLRGRSQNTLLLCGHLDTVDTQSYAHLERYACNPKELGARLAELAALAPDIKADLDGEQHDWLFGRGVLDMKSGLAVAIAVMRHFAKQSSTSRPPLSLLFLATADEENESAGIRQAVHFLLQLRNEHNLTYVGAINLDWTTSRYPGDPHRYIYSGSIGKLLPSFLVIGKEAHAGTPFDGIDADLLVSELVQSLSLNNEFSDCSKGQQTPPPVTLHLADLKKRYDIQLPVLAHFSLNVLTFTTTPQKLLARLKQHTERVLAQTLKRISAAEQQWIGANVDLQKALHPCHGVVFTYTELYDAAIENVGEQQVLLTFAAEKEHWAAGRDKRECCLSLVQCLWKLSGKQNPAVIIYYAPPYYPHVPPLSPGAGVLYQALLHTIEEHPQHQLELLEYFPFVSDMSYLQLDPAGDASALRDNMPVWESIDAVVAEYSYNLPLAEMLHLQIPVVNIGPYGHGAHQPGERVLMSYSFGVVPELLCATIKHLARLLEEE